MSRGIGHILGDDPESTTAQASAISAEEIIALILIDVLMCCVQNRRIPNS